MIELKKVVAGTAGAAGVLSAGVGLAPAAAAAPAAVCNISWQHSTAANPDWSQVNNFNCSLAWVDNICKNGAGTNFNDPGTTAVGPGLSVRNTCPAAFPFLVDYTAFYIE